MLPDKIDKQIFISHAWGIDELERNNHERCKYLYDLLTKSKYSVWFDEIDIKGNIDNSIIKGINNSSIIIICLTKHYCNKINNAVLNNQPNDNCYKEWNYSLFKNRIMIPILMEPSMKEVFETTEGVIQMYLNNTLYIDMSKDIDEKYKELEETLNYYGIYNKLELTITPNSSNNSLSNYFLSNFSPKKSPKNEKNEEKSFKITKKKKLPGIITNCLIKRKMVII